MSFDALFPEQAQRKKMLATHTAAQLARAEDEHVRYWFNVRGCPDVECYVCCGYRELDEKIAFLRRNGLPVGAECWEAWKKSNGLT